MVMKEVARWGANLERPGFSRPFCLDHYAMDRFDSQFPLEIICLLIVEGGN